MYYNEREFDKSGLSGFATGIETESEPENDTSLHILRFFRCIYRATYGETPKQKNLQIYFQTDVNKNNGSDKKRTDYHQFLLSFSVNQRFFDVPLNSISIVGF